MAEVITRLNVESSAYESKLKRATASLNAMTTAAEQQGRKIDFANQKNLALVKSLGNMQTVSTTARGQMQELTQAIESATLVYNRMDASMKKGEGGRALNASIGQLQTRLAGLKTEMAAVQTSMGKINVGSLGGGMGIGAQFGQGLKSAAMMFGPAALAIGGVTAAIGGMKKVVGDMVSLNMQFEQSTANLASIMGKSTEEISALTEQAKQLGATTRYTANEITELQTNLARLGFTQQEILNSTSAVQALATATGADLGEAANLAGAALRGFGLNATEMERVASVLSVSTTKSALSFEKLATAVPIVAPVAKQFGFTIEDTVTLLAKLSDAGMDASTAATATRNIFLKMADGSGKLSQAMGRPVHSVEEFGEALKEMREKGMSLNDILKMVGVRSTAAFAVFADNADTLKDFKDSITDCSEAMHDMEAKQLNTLQGSVTILSSAWEGLMLSFSQSTGPIKTAVDALTELLQKWTTWRNRNKGDESAIKTYELSDADVQKAGTERLKQMREAQNGRTGEKWYKSDDEIKKVIEGEIVGLKKEEEALKKLEDTYTEYFKLLDKMNTQPLEQWELAKKNRLSKQITDAGYTASAGDTGLQKLLKDIAEKRNKQSINDYILDSINPAPVVEDNKGTGKGGGIGGQDNSLTAKSRADIEAQMLKDIADLDKVNKIKLGKEQEYEDEVFAIKLAAYERIKQLYAEDTKEYAQMEAKIAQLKIQHQGTTLRLANKGNSSSPKPKEEKLLNYSQEGIVNLGSQIKSQMSKSEIGSEGYLLAADQLLDFTTFENLLKAATERGVQPDPEWMASLFDDIKIGADVAPETWQALVDRLNEMIEEAGKELPPIELDVKTGVVTDAGKAAKAEAKSTADAWQNAVAAVNNVGSALQQLEDPAAKVSGIVMQAVANIALGFAQAAASPATGAAGVFGWIAAATAGVATMVSTIAAIKSATSGSYASGGIIPGNSFSGDNLTANVNSGELILNRAQQGAIAGQLQGAAQQTVMVEGRISGKDILLSANNTNRAAGGSRGYYTKVK